MMVRTTLSSEWSITFPPARGGIRHQCGISIYSIDLTSGTNIFSFDGNGINSPPFNVPGNAKDNTGYGGPSAYFTNINSAGTSGRVNFITPIPPGGSSYFSLENVLTASSACTNILNNSVPKPATPASGDPIVQEDAIGIRLRDVIGVDNMMW